MVINKIRTVCRAPNKTPDEFEKKKRAKIQQFLNFPEYLELLSIW